MQRSVSGGSFGKARSNSIRKQLSMRKSSISSKGGDELSLNRQQSGDEKGYKIQLKSDYLTKTNS